MAYCRCCGVFADLDDAKMCDRCRRDWQPAGSKPDDLGASGPRGGGGKPAHGRNGSLTRSDPAARHDVASP